MDLAQKGRLDWISGGRSKISPMSLWTALMSIGLAAAFLAGAVYGRAGAGTTSVAGSVDPLTQPAAIEFRQSEHAATGAAAFDSLTQPAAIEFRRSEHDASAGSRSLVDPLTQPAAIEFRNSERDAGR